MCALHVFFAELVAAATLLSLLACIGHAVLTGRIRFAGLLSDSFDNTLSGGRVQALIASIAVALAYAALAIQHLARGEAASLPDAQDWMIAVLGGSQLSYLVAKGLSAKITLNLRAEEATKGGTK